jgi:hypothetical protein
MNDTIQTLTRSLFKFLAAYLATRGLTIDNNNSEAIIGGVIALASVLWGIWHRNTPASSQPTLPGLKLLILAALIPLLGTGCMSMANLAAELKNDPATVDMSVATIYGNFMFHRSFPTNWVAAQPVLTLPK